MQWFFVFEQDNDDNELYVPIKARDMDSAFSKARKVAARKGWLSFRVQDQSGEHNRHFLGRAS